MSTAIRPAPAVTPPGTSQHGRESLAANRRRITRIAYALLAPTLIAMAVVVAYPIVLSFFNSFQNDAHLDTTTGLFVAGGFAGVTNYLHWLLQRCGNTACAAGNNGALFYTALFNTFFFTIVTVVLETCIGLWMAIIMNRNFRGRGILRAAVLVPWAIPTAVTAQLAGFIFAPAGIVNAVTGSTTLWTTDLWASRFAIIVSDTWKTTPFMALLLLAGLQLIPEDVYEAARMDGATTVQQFFRITLPLLRPALIVAVLFRTLDALRMYDLPAILANGSTGTVTLSTLVVSEIRNTALNSAAGLSTITFIIIFLVAFLFIRVLGANITGNPTKSRKVAGEQ